MDIDAFAPLKIGAAFILAGVSQSRSLSTEQV